MSDVAAGLPTTDVLPTVSMKRGRAHAPRLSVPYDPDKPRHERYWSEAELAIVREEFPKGGSALVQLRLPNRSRASIYQAANKLGLRAVATPRRRWELTAEIEARMREAWPGLQGRGAVTRFIEGELQVPKHIGIDWFAKLGLVATVWKKETTWTAAEDLLMARVPLHSPDTCARIFREHGFSRSPTAIVVRAKRLELSRRYKDRLSANAAAHILGVEGKTLSEWCLIGDLRAARREGSRRLPQQGGAPWDIERAELRRFVIDNIARLDIRKVDKAPFVDLLVAEAPVVSIDTARLGRDESYQRAALLDCAAGCAAVVASFPAALRQELLATIARSLPGLVKRHKTKKRAAA